MPHVPFAFGILWILGSIIGIILLLLFLGLLFRLIFWGTFHERRRRWWRYQDEALTILRSRYAKGEITKEEYLEMLKNLEERQ